MVHPLASQCGFFLISDPAITIGAIPPHSVQCIVLEMAIHKLHNGMSKTGHAGPTGHVYLTYAMGDSWPD